MVHAIIVAAGEGRRARMEGKGVRKQFVNMAGRPVIMHTLAPFQLSAMIDTVVCVVAQNDLLLLDVLQKRYPTPKIVHGVVGGATRQASVAAGLRFLEKAILRMIWLWCMMGCDLW